MTKPLEVMNNIGERIQSLDKIAKTFLIISFLLAAMCLLILIKYQTVQLECNAHWKEQLIHSGLIKNKTSPVEQVIGTLNITDYNFSIGD